MDGDQNDYDLGGDSESEGSDSDVPDWGGDFNGDELGNGSDDFSDSDSGDSDDYDVDDGGTGGNSEGLPVEGGQPTNDWDNDDGYMEELDDEFESSGPEA